MKEALFRLGLHPKDILVKVVEAHGLLLILPQFPSIKIPRLLLLGALLLDLGDQEVDLLLALSII